MIRQFELVERIRDYNPAADEALINRAYVFGAKAHAHQTRASGEPYFGHPIEVAAILAGLRLDDATIVTALLHDTVEDTDVTLDDVSHSFGDEIAQLVEGVTKLSKLELTSKETAQAENFRKLLVAMSRDVRVLLVKLSDRLHNMRTLGPLRPDKRERIARETMDVFAPLAGRMGMQKMREELEDLAFDVLNPEARTSVMRRFLKLRRETGDMIPAITGDIEQALYDAGVSARVTGREKRPYSIWRKMEEKNVGFAHLSDIYAFRVITRDEAACYSALGAVHRQWRAVPERVKDYISGPKANGYRSIHTTVYGPKLDGKTASRVEIQIRTEEMHEVAEQGVAAHWAYREGKRSGNRFAVDPFSWLRDLVTRIEQGDAPQEFLENVKLDLYLDQVFCFTPKGDVIGLPRGATPLDFAYAIHTKLGHSTVGAKVDGQRVPLWTRLRNGQAVDIIRSDGQRPSPVWMDIAETGRARAAIRRALREDRKREHAEHGAATVAAAFARRGKDAPEKTLATAARKLGMASVEMMLASVGAGELAARVVVEAVYPRPGSESRNPADGQPGPHAFLRGARPGEKIVFASCCNPLPGERIVAIEHPLKGSAAPGIDVHTIDCGKLASLEGQLDRWRDVRWEEDANALAAHVVQIEIATANQPGSLGHICTLIGEARANIDNIAIIERNSDFFRLNVDVEVRDTKHLSAILTTLEAQLIVSRAARRGAFAPERPGEAQPDAENQGGAQGEAPQREASGAEAQAARPAPAGGPGAAKAGPPGGAKTAAPGGASARAEAAAGVEAKTSREAAKAAAETARDKPGAPLAGASERTSEPRAAGARRETDEEARKGRAAG